MLRVDPYLSIAMPGDAFNITERVENVQDLFSWQVAMSFNPAVIEAVNVTYGDFLEVQPQGIYQIPPALNTTHGWTCFGEVTLGRQPDVDGSGILATVLFNVKASGHSYFNITDLIPITATSNATTVLLDSSWPDPLDIPFVTEDGIFVAGELANFYEQYLALNASYYSLLADFQTLLSEYEDLESDYASLNATFTSMLSTYTSLQTDQNSLQSEYVSLNASHSELEATYASLNSTYSSLKTDYENLESRYETSTGELGTVRPLNYVLIGTTIALIASTAYLLGYIRTIKAKSS